MLMMFVTPSPTICHRPPISMFQLLDPIVWTSSMVEQIATITQFYILIYSVCNAMYVPRRLGADCVGCGMFCDFALSIVATAMVCSFHPNCNRPDSPVTMAWSMSRPKSAEILPMKRNAIVAAASSTTDAVAMTLNVSGRKWGRFPICCPPKIRPSPVWMSHWHCCWRLR